MENLYACTILSDKDVEVPLPLALAKPDPSMAKIREELGHLQWVLDPFSKKRC